MLALKHSITNDLVIDNYNSLPDPSLEVGWEDLNKYLAENHNDPTSGWKKNTTLVDD